MAPCTMAMLMSTHSPPPMSLSLAPPAPVSPIHGPATMEAMMDKMMEKMTTRVVCTCVCVFLLAFHVHFAVFGLIYCRRSFNI